MYEDHEIEKNEENYREAKINVYENGLRINFSKPNYSEEELNNKIIEYFDVTSLPTYTGLILYLGFSSKGEFEDLAKIDEKYKYIVQRAKLAISSLYENNLLRYGKSPILMALRLFFGESFSDNEDDFLKVIRSFQVEQVEDEEIENNKELEL